MGISNREWLYSLEPSELSAWFDADCSETVSTNKLTSERDAAYAKNRALKQHISNMQEGRNGWHTKAEKLQAKVTELTAERNELQAKVDAKDNCIENIMQTLHETQARASNLADDLLTANRQREQYRKLFGMALDWAHEITMLESSIDEGMA